MVVVTYPLDSNTLEAKFGSRSSIEPRPLSDMKRLLPCAAQVTSMDPDDFGRRTSRWPTVNGLAVLVGSVSTPKTSVSSHVQPPRTATADTGCHDAPSSSPCARALAMLSVLYLLAPESAVPTE